MRHLCFIFLLLLSCSGQSDSREQNTSTDTLHAGKEVTCFVYHRFNDSRYPTTNVSVSDFQAHLQYLVDNKFHVVTFSEAIAYLKSDEPARKTAVITIDDAYKSFFKNGLPVLRKYKLPATLFINTKTVGAGDYMDWTSLQTAMDSGVEIGNHTHSHDFFLDQDAASRYKTFRDEIELSQTMIHDHLNVTPTVFSYPYGEFDARMRSIAKEFNFVAAAAQNSGVLYSGSDLFAVPRFPMSEAYAAIGKFKEKAQAKALDIKSVSPDDSAMPANYRPELTLTIANDDLRMKQLQCFVQGGSCDWKVVSEKDGQTVVRFQSTKPITSRRRTLYTITVPDTSGKWHWYSHLWINPKIKG